MRILATGDLHGDIDLVNSLISFVANNPVDVLLLCGDIFCDAYYDSKIVLRLKSLNVRIYFVPGNHESIINYELLKDNGFKSLHGSFAICDDVGLFGCGFGEVGFYRLSNEEMKNILISSNSKLEKNLSKRIMVTHIHPKGSNIEKFSSIVKGSSAITEAIFLLKPDYLFCSHVHEAKGYEEIMGQTKVVNVSKCFKLFNI